VHAREMQPEVILRRLLQIERRRRAHPRVPQS
jgi:hypothetical protein